MYKYPESPRDNLRMFVLWFVFLIFVLAGIAVGSVLGLILFAGIALLLQIVVADFTSIAAQHSSVFALTAVPFLLIGIAICIYGFCLLWMLCMKPFFVVLR
jgi:hypothetical protein